MHREIESVAEKIIASFQNKIVAHQCSYMVNFEVKNGMEGKPVTSQQDGFFAHHLINGVLQQCLIV